MRNGWKRVWLEGWAFLAVAVVAFVAGLLIGDLGSSPSKEVVYLSRAESEEAAAGEEEAAAAAPSAEAPAEGGEAGAEGATSGSPGAQIFTSAGCGSCHTLAAAGSTGTTGPNLDESLAPDDNVGGIEVMIVNPNTEVVEGYPPNVMPQNFGQTLSKEEVHQLAEYLVETTPAK